MRFFLETWKDIGIVLDNLAAMQCPLCGATGTLIRHGFNRGFIAPRRRGVRSRRVRCKRSSCRNGCTHTFSLKLGATLPRRCFRAKGLWKFIQKLRQGASIKNAWEQCGIRLSLDTGYRVHKRIVLCLPVLRTRLSGRSPPPVGGESAGSAITQMFNHLHEVFGDACAVRAFQEALQRDFLAIS